MSKRLKKVRNVVISELIVMSIVFSSTLTVFALAPNGSGNKEIIVAVEYRTAELKVSQNSLIIENKQKSVTRLCKPSASKEIIVAEDNHLENINVINEKKDTKVIEKKEAEINDKLNNAEKTVVVTFDENNLEQVNKENQDADEIEESATTNIINDEVLETDVEDYIESADCEEQKRNEIEATIISSGEREPEVAAIQKEVLENESENTFLDTNESVIEKDKKVDESIETASSVSDLENDNNVQEQIDYGEANNNDSKEITCLQEKELDVQEEESDTEQKIRQNDNEKKDVNNILEKDAQKENNEHASNDNKEPVNMDEHATSLPINNIRSIGEENCDEYYVVDAPTRIYNVDWNINPNYWTYSETEWKDTGKALVEGHYGSKEEVEKMYELINNYRIANGRAPLTYNNKMDTCKQGAGERAITSANYWEHWSYRFSENIAYTPVFYSGYDDMEMVEKVFESWINSPGHRNNILNAGSRYYETAISVFYKKVDGGYERYWVQVFR